jgi:hypothetical protein
MKLFVVVEKGSKKAVENLGFSDKIQAKEYRDSLNAGKGYDAKGDISGKAMPYHVSKGSDHIFFKKG